MEGNCRTPIAALAEFDVLTLTSRVALPDGSEMHEDRRSGPGAGAERLGTEASETCVAESGRTSWPDDGG